jgi:hypothetical protein
MVVKRADLLVIWSSRVLRWSLGLLMLVFGYIHIKEENAWIMIGFGIIIITTGFLRPRRCLGEQSCKVKGDKLKN